MQGRILHSKRGKEKQHQLLYNILAVGKNIKRGRGLKFLGRKSRFKKKNGGREEYEVVGNYIHPCILYFSTTTKTVQYFSAPADAGAGLPGA